MIATLLGAIWGGFGEGSGRVLEGFGEDFERGLANIWEKFG